MVLYRYIGKEITIMAKDVTEILKRCPENPIINPDDYPGIARIYNPAVAKMGDETILLASVIDHACTKGYGADCGQARVARSKDGINFELDDKDFIYAPDVYRKELYHHFVNSRMTKIDDTYYIATPVKCHGYLSTLIMLGKTKDFEKYEPINLISGPIVYGSALFPEKINGKYCRLDRMGEGKMLGEIWLSYSDDLEYWGEHKPIMVPGYRYWCAKTISPTTPIKTSKGWLVLINGYTTPAGGGQYSVGAILLDLNNPRKVIGKTNSPLLFPKEWYELHGFSDNTVYSCGAVADEAKDMLTVYYGGAEKYICMAQGKLSDVIDACINEL